MMIKKATATVIFIASLLGAGISHAEVSLLKGNKDIYECGNISTALSELMSRTLEGIARQPEAIEPILQVTTNAYFFMNLENCVCTARYFSGFRERREVLTKCLAQAQLLSKSFLVTAQDNGEMPDLEHEMLGLLP